MDGLLFQNDQYSRDATGFHNVYRSISIAIVILAAIVEVILIFMLIRYQKRQDKRIMQLM